MPISHTHRCIFVHIPKTAGTSVEKALGMFGDWRHEDRRIMFGHVTTDSQLSEKELTSPFLQHLTALELSEMLPEQFQSYLKFTIVRNPWDRLVSAYSKKDVHMCQYSAASGIDLEHADFDEFVLLTAELDHAHLRPQIDYLTDREGTLLVDSIVRWETLKLDFAGICSRLGVDCTLPTENVSQRGDYRDYYSETSKKLIGERYRGDIEAFGYMF